ncbi:aldehyde dehydrogenase family protein [Fluviibacterium sp. DFM31]|uniref:Aldehyde dehydrogenase family protein n=1 Tax=Meridianimarinicoccus marinus TaxID=3231483 RepID=A0ABV3L7I0_9RHOB
METYRCFIGNQWIDSSSGARFSVENPATGEVWAEMPDCTAEDAQAALESSYRAQQSWALLPAQTRAEYLYKICDALKAEKAHFARLLVLEQGKSLAAAAAEVDDTVRYMSYAAEAARRLRGDIFPADRPNEQLFIYRVPYGVTIGLCAYNYPLALIGRKLGPALVTGNTMILKPNEATPVTASEFCKLVLKAGLPKGVVNMLSGTGIEMPSKLVTSPMTRLVSMTGSTPGGQAIAKSASENLAALVLELGGNAPFVVLKDADIDAAAEAAVTARYANCGQVCICAEAVLVEDSVADEFTEKVLAHAARVQPGDPMTNGGMGPLTTAGARDRTEKLVAASVAGGAEIALGGNRPQGEAFESGHWYAPTVLVNARADTPCVAEETFGPVLPIVKIDGFEEALAITNARRDGLSAYLWTRDQAIQMDAIQRMETGTIFMNQGIIGYIQGYHNGHKLSGLGGEDGVHGLDCFLQKRTVYMKY